MMFKWINILLFILCWGTLRSQQIALDRVLIGAGYSEYDNGSSMVLSASVGEPAVQTGSGGSIIITQGFQQSNYVLSNPLIADLAVDSAACIGANNGALAVAFVSEQITQPYTYAWSTGASTQSITGLEVGTYSVTVTGSNGLSVVNSIMVSAVDSVDCTPGFYTGITPNGDNSNDYWHVDNAEYFSKKTVSIFNRYGAKVWETDDYNNVTAAFSGNHQNGQPLPVGTYYFTATFDDSNFKGWIEISR